MVELTTPTGMGDKVEIVCSVYVTFCFQYVTVIFFSTLRLTQRAVVTLLGNQTLTF
jgi:hypothetical protein